jgi:hypothetical protein
MMTRSKKDCPMSLANKPDQRTTAIAPSACESDRMDRPRRRWRRFGVVLAVVVLPCIVLLAGNLGYRHHRAVAAIQAAVAELDQQEPGWRLADIEAARAIVADDENSALVVSRAFALLPPSWPTAGVGDRLNVRTPQARLNDEDAAWLADELCQRQDALLEARKLADLPKGRHPIAFKSDFVSTLLPSQQNTRSILSLLQLDAMLRAQEGDMKGALHSCRALLNAARSLGDEPLLISQLIRIAGVAVACSTIERVLAQGEPEPDDLIELQKLLEEEERFPRLLVAVRGERGGIHECLNSLESGALSLTRAAGTTPSAWDRLTDYASRDQIRSRHPAFLALHTEMVRIAALPAHKRDEPLEALDAKVRSEPPGSVIRLLMPAITKVDDAARRTDGHLRCLIAAVAAERYRRRHGHLPDRLGQLVPEFLSTIPLDSKDGEPLRFHERDDRVVIYSHYPVPGHDGLWTIYDPTDSPPPGVGVAVHLFKPEHRRQPPPPKPAEPPVKADNPHPARAAS